MNELQHHDCDVNVLMAMDYIRSYYGVPVQVGMRVVADGVPATICGAEDHYLWLMLDGDDRVSIWHPTWRIEYL